MTQQEDVRYEPRTVREWVEFAMDGRVGNADFQRSFVWDSERARKYVKAILDGKPVGLYLILTASQDEPQFRARPFSDVEWVTHGDVKELVLDGQQRLTSLLHALCRQADRRFYIEVGDPSASELEVKDVKCEVNTGERRKGPDEPSVEFAKGLIPIDVLMNTSGNQDEVSPLATWCIEVGKHNDHFDDIGTRKLEERIANFADRLFFRRKLWCCLLPESTTAEEATEIYIQTNTSSVKIKQFDVEVAGARGKHGVDLRQAIVDAYNGSEILRHYFSDDPEKYVPDIGSWMLKVACLHVDHPPKDKHNKDARDYLLSGRGKLEAVFEDLDWALSQAEVHGAATRKMVPSWPVLHVLAALRSRLDGVVDPARRGQLLELLDTYYWRCLFSNRHTAQANDRLHQDYGELVAAFGDESRTAELTAFENQDHPPFDEGHLYRHAGWIGSSRLGKALVSLVMAADPKPQDWITKESLSATLLRQLQKQGRLDRHHVFPKAALAQERIEKELISHGLNGVVLGRGTNRSMWKSAPDQYIREIAENHWKGRLGTLRGRIESHVVPYSELESAKGPMRQRYDRFLKKRAKMLARQIDQLATP